MCYKINQTHAGGSKYMTMSVTPSVPGMILQVKMSKSLGRSEFLKLSIHGTKIYPLRSLVVIPVVNRHYNEVSGIPGYHEFTVTQTRMTIVSLPPPYTTNCMKYETIGFEHETACAHDCIWKATKSQMNKIPFSVHVHEGGNYTQDDRVVSHEDAAKNPKGIEKISDNCYNTVCKRHECSYRHALTHTTSQITSGSPEDFVIKYTLPSAPSIFISSSAKFSLLEFITYMLSIISTWTGLAVYHLNPVTAFIKASKCVRRFVRRRREQKKMMMKPKAKWVVADYSHVDYRQASK